MAVKIKSKESKKGVTKEAQSSSASKMAALVDELGKVKAQISAHAKKMEPATKQAAKLEAELLTWADMMYGDDQKGVVEGEKYEVEITAKGNKTEITENEDAFNMLEAIEEGLSWALLKFGITDLKKYLTPKQFDEISITSRCSKRRVKVTDKTNLLE